MSAIDQLFESAEEMDMKQKIVEELLNSDKNLEAKTELMNPLRWSCLNLIEGWIKDHKLPISCEILKEFKITSFKYLISNNRNGRKEYIEALKSLAHMDDNEKPNINSLMKG